MNAQDDLIQCLIADGTMIAPTIAGESTPMIASIVNAQGLAQAASEMLARLALANWCGAQRGGIADAMLALSSAKLVLDDVLAYDDDDDDDE